MFEIVNIRGNSVRVKCGLFVADVQVIDREGRKQIKLPEGLFAHNFKTLAGLVLAAYNTHYKIEREIITNGSTEKETSTVH